MILLAGLVSGCEIWDPRPGLRDFVWGLGDDPLQDPTAEIRKKEYRTWPKPIREAVDGRIVLVGMTKNQAQAAMHLEEKSIQKGTASATGAKMESWIVWRLVKSWAYVKMQYSQMVTITFRDGLVTQIAAVIQQ